MALALAAALVALDRFYGFTSSWTRYLATAQDLKQALDEFRFYWEYERLRWTDGRPSDEQTTEALARFKGFVSQVNQIVRQETNAWIAEFRTSLQAIEEVAKVRARYWAKGGRTSPSRAVRRHRRAGR